jgi:hypothetical protein
VLRFDHLRLALEDERICLDIAVNFGCFEQQDCAIIEIYTHFFHSRDSIDVQPLQCALRQGSGRCESPNG